MWNREDPLVLQQRWIDPLNWCFPTSKPLSSKWHDWLSISVNDFNVWNLQTGKHHLKFFWRCKSHVSPRWFSKQNWVENRMRLIFYSISKFIQFIRSSLYCARCLCCHDNALAAFVTRAKGQQNCCWCSLKSSKYANEINIPSEYELTDGKNLLVNNDNSNSKETKLNV